MGTQFKRFLLFSIAIIVILSVFAKANKPRVRGKECCGKVIKLYYSNTKSNIITPRVIFYCDSLQKNIDVVADEETFDSLTEGGDICVFLKSKNFK